MTNIRYKYTGSTEEAESYGPIGSQPIIGRYYSEENVIGKLPISKWKEYAWFTKEWEEVDMHAERQEILDKVHSHTYENQLEEKFMDNSKAMRFNSGKPKYSMLDLGSFEQGVRVLEFGANKYARDNWRNGLKFSEVLDSLMRHIKGLQNGEWLDPESGLPHIGHIQANAMFIGYKGTEIDLEILKQEPE